MCKNVKGKRNMRYLLRFLTIAALGCGLASIGWTEDAAANKTPETKKVEATVDTTPRAELLAAMHRTMADLIEARAAKQPDQAKIDALTKKLQELRGKIRSQRLAAAPDVTVEWNCPWGGPGLGYGRVDVRRGGRGMGPGRGFGVGVGLGAGRGVFVDLDNDGFCDYYELRHGQHH